MTKIAFFAPSSLTSGRGARGEVAQKQGAWLNSSCLKICIADELLSWERVVGDKLIGDQLSVGQLTKCRCNCSHRWWNYFRDKNSERGDMPIFFNKNKARRLQGQIVVIRLLTTKGIKVTHCPSTKT